MYINKRSVLISALTLIVYMMLISVPNLKAGSFVAFGPVEYARSSGKPYTEILPFTVYNPKTSYTIHIYNGGKNGEFEKKVSSALIMVNDSLIVFPGDFNQNVEKDHFRIRRFAVLYKLLDVDDGELTKTGKIRRKFILEKYKDLYDALYDQNVSHKKVETFFQYQDGQTTTVETTLEFFTM